MFILECGKAAIATMNFTDEYTVNATRCIRIPPAVNSLGTWAGDKPLNFPLPALEMQILVIFILTQLIHLPLRCFCFPRILAEIIAGIILGPTMPKPITKFTKQLFPPDTQETMATLSAFGYTFLVFLIGVKTDATLVMKTGKKAVTIGILSLMVPFTIGMVTETFLRKYGEQSDSVRSVVTIQSLTPFPGIALLLKDLKLLNSELGRLALSSGTVAEVMNVMLITSMNMYRVYLREKEVGAVYIDIAAFICFILIVFLIIRPAMLWIVKQTPEGRDVKTLYLYAAILVALVACALTHYFDQYVLLGAFVIGLAIPDGPPMGSALVDRFDFFVTKLLVPLFVTTNASRADLRMIRGHDSPVAVYFIIIPLIFMVKLAATVISAWFSNVPLRDAFALGLILCSKGVVELASYSLARNQELINEPTMAIMIVTTAVTAVATTTSVRKLYNPKRKYAGYQSRNIMHTKMNGELRVVACLHRPDNINGFINLIDASGPTRETPMTIFFLHLVELHGRASPIFISHQLQKKRSSGLSYSEDILLASRQCESKKEGAVSTQCFTAISPRNLIHEDICTLALDKLASLVIVPFHRKWDFQGSIESEDNALRTLNEKLLDIAPCSVGIFVDRGLIARESSLSVAMVFFGGNDDREALTYAKRLARDSTISLTVIHCVAQEDNYLNRREKSLDAAVLKDVKENNVGADFVYFVEEKVNDSPETARLIRGVIHEYDLIIVGRRHNVESSQTSGLSAWSEFPELGVIGDFLATVEGKCRASVLIIQQQKQLTH